MPTFGKASHFEINDGTSSRVITPYITQTDVDLGQDALDSTTYGDEAHEFVGGLENGTITITGLWDDTTNVGTRTVFKLLRKDGTPRAFIWGPEGSTTGMEKSSGSALVTSYRESSPVAGLVTFTATMNVSGVVTDGTF